MLQANAMGFFGVVSAVMCWGFAALLFRVSASGSVARKLAVLLVFEGVTLLSSSYLDLFFTPAAIASSWYATFDQVQAWIHRFGDCVLLALYPID